MNARRVQEGLLAFAIVLALMNVSIWLAGAAPLRAWIAVWNGTGGSAYGIAQTLAKATPLILTGVSVSLALRAGLFNLGAEGQAATGVLFAAVLGARLPAWMPWPVALPLAVLSAALGGALMGAFVGWLKGRLGAHEVITALMLNGLVGVMTTYLYGGPLRDGAQVHTRPVVLAAQLPSAGSLWTAWRGSALNAGVVLALLLPFVVRWYLQRTAGGLRLRALGDGPSAARALGVPMVRATTMSMALAGACAGLVGAHYVLGVKHYAEEGLGTGVGFVGIAVAMLGGNSPFALIGAALLFGALSQGGLAVNALVPADIFAVAQAATIVAVAAMAARVRQVPA